MRRKQKEEFGKKAALHKDLPFLASEQYKRLRTNLQFTLMESIVCPIIGVSSSIRGEGKSTTAINLAYALAEDEKRVLLIDGDLRLPTIARRMGISNARGLTDFLIGRERDIEGFSSSVLGNWYILPSGKLPPNPSELLGSAKMKTLLEEFKKAFDYIVIDLPPVNMVSDALSIAKAVDGFLLVAREGYTPEKQLEQCVRQLRLAEANILGLVMNDVDAPKIGYKKYGKHGYRA